MTLLIVTFSVTVAGTLVLLYWKRRSIVGRLKHLIAGDDNTSAKSKKPATDPNYTNILRKRFENGEITEDEYEKMKKDLD